MADLKKVRFIQGNVQDYFKNKGQYEDAIYFCTDTGRLYLNEMLYGNTLSNIWTVEGQAKAQQYFVNMAERILSGELLNIVRIQDPENGQNGIAFATYKDKDNFRVDAYVSNKWGADPTGIYCVHIYSTYANGVFSSWREGYDYQYLPFCDADGVTAEDHKEYFNGLKETWIESTDGVIAKHWWDGEKYDKTILPTSQNVTKDTTLRYSIDFTKGSSVTYSSMSAIRYDQFTLYQMMYGGVNTMVFADTGFIMNSGNLYNSASGTRYICPLNQNGSPLAAEDVIYIKGSVIGGGNIYDREKTSSQFEVTHDDDTDIYAFTVKQNTTQDNLFIGITRGAYLSYIKYNSTNNTSTFTVSTPNGISTITAMSGIMDGSITATKLASNSVTAPKIANSAVTTDKLAEGSVTTSKIYSKNVTEAKIADSAISTAKLKDSSVTTAKIADGAITKDKLASDITLDGTSDSELSPLRVIQALCAATNQFNGFVDNVTMMTSIPSTATDVMVGGVYFDTTKQKFVVYATFTANNTSLANGAGYYYITWGGVDVDEVDDSQTGTPTWPISRIYPNTSNPSVGYLYICKQKGPLDITYTTTDFYQYTLTAASNYKENGMEQIA